MDFNIAPCKKRSQIRTQQKSIGSSQVDIVFFLGIEAVDSQLKTEFDNPSIGLLLCKSKNNLVAEYALRDMSKPIGVSEYKLTGILPDVLENRLPSPEDIQNRIGKQE